MKRNDKLYEAIEAAISEKKKCKFAEIEKIVKRVLGEEVYDERQLRNVLYRLVKLGELNKTNEGEYCKNDRVKKADVKKEKAKKEDTEEVKILNNYIEKIRSICIEEEKKLYNPFDKFSEKEIVEAKKVYELNKKILILLKRNSKEYRIWM